jgi:hypothetical protein
MFRFRLLPHELNWVALGVDSIIANEARKGKSIPQIPPLIDVS